MESTVQPDKKLIVETLAQPNRSSTGFIITPPPIPHMAPATDAAKLTKKNNKDCPIVITIPLFLVSHVLSSYITITLFVKLKIEKMKIIVILYIFIVISF